MRRMNKSAILSFMLLMIVVCLSMAQGPVFAYSSVLPHLFVASNSTSDCTIVTSGIVVEPTKIRKHLVAYGASRGFDDETADFIASNFDILDTSWYPAVISGIEKMKAANPKLIVLLYRDVMAMRPYYEDWAEVDSHEDWFIHDIYGDRLINRQYGWYCMDVENDGWRNHYANWTKNKLDSYPFDGVFADDVWDYFIYEDKWTVPPGDIPTEIGERWHDDMLEMIKFVKSVIGRKLLIVNTPNNNDYVDACDGKMEEGFVHPSWYSYSEFRSIDQWIDKINGVRNVSQKGKYTLVHSGFKELRENKTFVDLHPEIVHKMLMYCFSSYLLAINGSKASFGFGSIYNLDGSRGYYSEFDGAKQLGSPINDYYLFDSVFSRDFVNGKVLVNPTTSSYTVSLGQNYKTLDGKTVSSVTLDDHTGVILLRM